MALLRHAISLNFKVAASETPPLLTAHLTGLARLTGGVQDTAKDNCGGWFTSVRNASKKSGGSSKNTKGRPRGKARGPKRVDGDWVTAGSILVRQLGLDFLPGLNVGIGRDRTLYAKYHGHVMVTTEKVDPNWDHKIVKRFKGLIQADEGAPIFKTYYHILTEPQKNNFKLVDQI